MVRKSAGINPANVHSNKDLYVSAGSYSEWFLSGPSYVSGK